MAVRIADTLKQQNNLTTFPVAYGEDIWLDENKGSGTADYDSLQNLYNDGKLGGSSIQVETMPAASASNVGKIVQYVGETGTYKKGHFYECIWNRYDTTVYEWRAVDHFRFNHPVYSLNCEPVNSDFIAGDIIYYTGASTDRFKENHFYRALPDATKREYYQAGFWFTESQATVYYAPIPFELRIGFIFTTSDQQAKSYQLTAVNEDGITITPYGWSGEPITYLGVTFPTTVQGWEELEGGGGTSIFYGNMADWEALSTEQKKQYDYMADDDAGGSYIDTYSTSEVKTNKVWIDGKPVYRKSWKDLNIGVNEESIGTINNLDTVVNIEASISQYTTTSATTLAFKKPYVRSQASIDVKSNGVFCKSGSGFDRINVVAVEYTKN